MTFSANAVYSRIRQRILEEEANAYVTSRQVPAPPKFPCVYVRQIDISRPRANMQLDGKDEQWESNFEIQISSNKSGGAAAEAEKLWKAADGVMRSLFYRGINCTPIDDGTKYTIAARYRRIIGGGDRMSE